jgi:UDP-N-acetylmuramoyl-L-alanyl-D-glutamate--2,6-diaminopimelate ligase
MLVGELISGLDIRPLPRPRAAGGRTGATPPESIRICDITEDSRTALPGSLFVARRGLTEDGRRFVPQAVEAGAVAVLTDDEALPLPAAGGRSPEVAVLVTPDVNLAAARLAERFYGNPSSKLDLVGVTGTNGKTTITYLIHRLLNGRGGRGRRCGMISTVQIDDGVGVADAVLTTPPAIEISRTLAVMVEAGCTAAVMEVSSHALDQRRVAALAFDVGIFTNLTGDHLDYHGTMEHYAASKARLFEMLPPDGLAIVNAMDPAHERMIRDCRATVLRCALEGSPAAERAECVARIDRQLVRSTPVTLRGPWGVIEAELPLIGPHNVMNALQAVAAVWRLAPWTAAPGDTDPIGLATVAAPPGRLQLVSTADQPISVYVDYAHTDDALRNVLTVLRGVIDAAPATTDGERPQLWCVFGCGGDRDRSKRPRMGAVAAELADRVVITSDNPRTEDPRSIIDQVAGGALSVRPGAIGRTIDLEEDRERAIRAAIRRAGPGDVILIAGKGHETYQILPDGRGGTIRRDFDDRLVARDALRARFGDSAERSAEPAARRRRTHPEPPRRHDPPAPPQHPSRADPS